MVELPKKEKQFYIPHQSIKSSNPAINTTALTQANTQPGISTVSVSTQQPITKTTK